MKFNKIIISLFLALSVMSFATPVGAMTYLLANVKCAQQSTQGGAQETVTDANTCTPCDLIRVVVNGTNMFMSLSGVLALLMFIYAGILMATSYINPAGIQRAKDMMKYAVFGIVIIFLAYTIINTVIMSFYGGQSDFGPLYSITGQSSWGVCAFPTPSAQ